MLSSNDKDIIVYKDKTNLKNLFEFEIIMNKNDGFDHIIHIKDLKMIIHPIIISLEGPFCDQIY